MYVKGINGGLLLFKIQSVVVLPFFLSIFRYLPTIIILLQVPSPPFRKERFMLDEMFQQNASKFLVNIQYLPTPTWVRSVELD